MELLVIGTEQYNNGIAEELSEIVSMKTRRMMRRVPLRLLKKAYKLMMLSSSYASVCVILGIDPRLAGWDLKLALEETVG